MNSNLLAKSNLYFMIRNTYDHVIIFHVKILKHVCPCPSRIETKAGGRHTFHIKFIYVNAEK